jgi:hypothetical protein
MSATFCWHCGEKWLHFDQSIRYPNSGKCVPLDEYNNRHDYKSCPKSPYNISKICKTSQKSELKKIDDHAILWDIREKIRHANNRLYGYKLELHVIRSLEVDEVREAA